MMSEGDDLSRERKESEGRERESGSELEDESEEVES